jgi:Fe-Mn family superoxide dismutase
VVLGFNEKLKMLENYWLADHASNPPDTRPILIMDMYEHAYQMDYGAAAPKYIDAFFTNINWDAVVGSAKRIQARPHRCSAHALSALKNTVRFDSQ